MASKERLAIKQNREMESLKVQLAEMQAALKRIEEKIDALISDNSKENKNVSGK